MAKRSEAARLRALDSYGVLDTPPEESFDRLTALAADIFDAPIALISLVDAERQWFKSRQGLEAQSTPRSWAFCAHTIELEAGATLVVEDAARDPRFRENPLVTGDPNIRFYAGVVLTDADGFNLGTLCVIDTKVRPAPSAEALHRLKTLADIVVDKLEIHRAARLAGEARRQLNMAERMSGVGRWRYHVSSGQVTWSDEVYRIHGVSRKSFDPDYDGTVAFYPEEDRAKVANLVAEAIRTGQGYEFELRIRRPDGDLRDVICKADCMLDSRGGVAAIYGVFQDVTDHKRALAALELGKARYKLLADNVGDVITRIGLDRKSRYVSPAVHKLLGYHPAEMAEHPAETFVYGPDQAVVLAAIDEMAQGAGEKTVQHRAAHKDGRLLWLESHFQLVRDEAGAPAEIVGVIRDITEQRKAEVAMAESEAKYRALAENSTDILVRVGPDGLIRYLSPACRALGLDPEEEVGQSIMRLIAPDNLKHSAEFISGLLSGMVSDPKARQLHKIINKSGREIWLEGSPTILRNEAGEVVEVMSVLRDVTVKHEMERALAESEHRFRSLTVNAPDMISESGLDGVLTYMSPACLAITGFTPEELIGQTSLTFMHPEDAAKVVEMCQAVLISNGAVAPWAVEYRARHKSGGEIWLESKPTPVTDPVSGAVVGLTDVIHDITPRKVLEARLRQAQSDAEAAAAVKAEFLANMSHELRTPLTSIIGFTSLAAEQADLAPLTRNYVERVGDASRALLCTVNDILDFSKLEAGQVSFHVQPVPLAKLSRATLDLFTPQAGAKDLTLTLEGDAEDLIISADPDRIRQILLNLVGNAVKFTTLGGVTLRTAYDRSAQTLSVEVVDTGAGVSPEQQERLFKRFSQVDGSLTRAHGGTGLGLAICKGLVEAMGGEIGVDSVVGQGSRFWFRIPAPLAQAAQGGADGPAIERLTFAGVRVLVADDHAANRELARLFLAGVGAEVSEACDGEEAAQLAALWPYDVILMDVRMPRLDGPGALRRIRETPGPNDATPILAYTADADAEIGGRLTAMGFQDIVAKPLDPRALISAVARATAFDHDQQAQEQAHVG
ncbi:PAS domain S-box protein [Phenylobacterium sp.]|uniref:PAS domain S-box protein n=1 Tax=Phenylobacterium sp. TaxID=1871053 RepID=UPI0027219AB5|nr:PAS domain S-box protein [Phenylobacterium sp.]MDO8380721.1 PAS domain S-box protein [Phenylobacterium sp.]